MQEVIIYSTPLCTYCHQAKIYFGEHNIPFREINVKEDVQARNEMIEKYSAKGVPVIVVGDKFLLGWNMEDFEALMAQQADATDSKPVQ